MSAVTFEDFSGQVNAVFAVKAGEAEYDLMLEAARHQGGGAREGGAFTLIFRGPSEPILPQATYRLERGDQAHDIFIVPIARDSGGVQYEAVFA